MAEAGGGLISAMRRWVIVAVVAVVALAGIGRRGAWLLLRPRPGPSRWPPAYLEAWGRGDWAALQAQVGRPPADFAAQHTAMPEALQVTQASFAPGRRPLTTTRPKCRSRPSCGCAGPRGVAVTEEGAAAGRPAGQPLAGRLVRRSPCIPTWPPAAASSGPGHFGRSRPRSWPPNGSELAGPGAVVTISIVGEQVKDRPRSPTPWSPTPEVAAGRPGEPWPSPSPAQPGSPGGHPAPRPTTTRSGTPSTRCRA